MNVGKPWLIHLVTILALLVGCAGNAAKDGKQDLIDQGTDFVTEFFDGEVQIVSHTIASTRFRVIATGAVLEIKNDLHIRRMPEPFKPPIVFSVLAPMTAVEIIDGEIPPNYLVRYPLTYYLDKRSEYERSTLGLLRGVDGLELEPHALLSRQDVRKVFSFNRSEWEAYARSLRHPSNFELRTMAYDTGTSVMALDSRKSYALSLQPFFSDASSRPQIFLVGQYYADGTFLGEEGDFRSVWEAAIGASVGDAYSVEINIEKLSPFGTIYDFVQIIIRET